jgi:SulP family sulfate permease
MQKRYKSEDSLLPHLKHKPFAALKETFKEGYKLNDLKQDLLSGAVVALVAIPLGMALAIASGVAPQHGLYTIIFGGIIAAILGGSRFQVTGPTAAFVVVLAPIAGKFGVGGLLTASMLAGFFLICMGALRMGRFIEFIPHPVTTGFTSGIALVIATMQIKDFFGLNITKMPDSYFRKIEIIFTSLGTAHFWDFFYWIHYIVPPHLFSKKEFKNTRTTHCASICRNLVLFACKIYSKYFYRYNWKSI